MFFLCRSGWTIPVSNSRVDIFNLGKREGKYWGEREEKSNFSCLAHPGAYILLIEEQQYNCVK